MDVGKQRIGAALMAGVLLGVLVLAGCNDDVEILRDPDVQFVKGMTWAWRPMTSPPAANRDGDEDARPVVSRDVIVEPSPTQHLESNRDWNTEANRKQLQEAVARAIKSKGLTQVNAPATADFLVDYHVAVKTRTATVGQVYPGWGWYGWGWGPPEVEYRNVTWHNGTFVLDVALRNPRKLAYRAIGHKELNNKSTISPYQAEEAVNHLLKGLKTK